MSGMSVRIPDLDAAKEAYAEGIIDIDTFERLAEAAITRTPTEMPDRFAIYEHWHAWRRDFTRPHTGTTGGYMVPTAFSTETIER